MLSAFKNSDTYLVHRTLNGHREAFSRLVERHQELVFAVAYGIVAHAADAEDVTQDTFLTAFKRLPDLREPGKFRPWLLAIARNRASDLIVKRRKESPLAEIDLASPEPSDTLADAELRALLRDRVERLPPEHREILLLHYYAGFKVKEIATQLDISTEAAKKRLQRARVLLSERMLVHLRDTVEEQGPSAVRAKSIVAAIAGASVAYSANAAAGTGLFTTAALLKIASAATIASGVVAVAILSAREPEPVPPPIAVMPLPTAEVAPTAPMSTPQPPAGTAATFEVDHESDTDKSTIPATFTFQGRIVNQAGAAQPGIRVTVDAAHEDHKLHEETMSDDEGRFSFANLDSERSYLLQGFGNDTFAAAELFNNGGPRNKTEDLVLLPAANLSGVVVDEEGNPIPDASVMPYQVPINGRSEHVGPWWQRLRGVRTDAEGRFTLSHAWFGPWTLQIDSPAHAIDLPELQMPLKAPQKITLKAGASVSGRVVRAGTDESVPTLKLAMGGRETVADEAGSFQFTGASPGNVNVELQNNNTYVVTSPPFTIFSGQSTDGIVVEVAVGGVIRGRITDETTGDPIPHASADFTESRSERSHMGYTNEDGTYEVSKLPPGRYTLTSVHGSDHAPVNRNNFEPITIDYGVRVENVDLKLSRGRTVSGTVDFPTGESRKNVHIMVRHGSGGGQGSSFDEHGAFSIGGLPESGMVTLQIEGPGWSSDAVGPFSLDSGDISGVNVVARRVALKAIKGRVVQGGSLPRADERIWLSSLDGSTTETTNSKSDGTFTFPSVAPGQYKLHIPKYHGKEELILVRANEETPEMTFDLSDGDGQISGRILDSRGAPVPGARVSAFGHGSFMPDVGADETGRYALVGLGDGTYDLTVQAEGFAIASRDQVAANSRDVDFRLEPVGHVEGTILDARSGKPISEFVIHSTGQIDQRGIDYALTTGEGKRQVSADGVFRAVDLAPGDRTVIARAQGYFAGYSIVKVPPGETVSNVAIRLQPAPGLTARVMDSEGAAIADAKVFINRASNTFNIDGFDKDVARTDASGIVPLENLQPGENTLFIYHPVNGRGIFTVDTRNQNGEQLLTLPAPGTLEGRITLGGQPVEQSRLAVSYAPENSIDQFQNYSAEVKEDGTFTVTGLMPGEALLRIDAQRAHEERTIQITSGTTTTFDFDFAGGTATIEITPVIPERFARAHCAARVSVETSEGKTMLPHAMLADGAIRMENVPAGAATILVSIGHGPENEIARTLMREIAEGEAIIETVDFTEGATITGTVANIGEEKEVYAVLVLGEFDPAELKGGGSEIQLRMTHQTLLGPDGAFQFDLVAPGTYTVFAGTDGITRIASQTIEVASSPVHIDLALP